MNQHRQAATAPNRLTERLAYEAARILCEEAALDYRSAKLKAAQRLGAGNGALPDNAEIQAAVIAYQRLYGGREYAERLRALRATAVRAMRLLAEFRPRLVGAVASGAITAAHRVQLHGFGEKPEALDLFLESRGIPYRQDDRSYRYPDGSDERVPLARFEAGEVGVDVAMFADDELRRLPLAPSDGLPMKRLNLAEAEALAALSADQILGE
jgi:hypothetical protein